MKFWDSSALVPLVVREGSTLWTRRVLAADGDVLVWALSRVEVRSALARQVRDGRLTKRLFDDARVRADKIFMLASQIVEIDQVCDRATRLLDLHALRSADALQLGAALVASHEKPSAFPFVCLDARLAEAASREGFAVESAP